MTDDPIREQAKAGLTIDALATEAEVARVMDHATSARGLDTGPETVPTGKRKICSQQEHRTGRESTARCTTCHEATVERTWMICVKSSIQKTEAP